VNSASTSRDVRGAFLDSSCPMRRESAAFAIRKREMAPKLRPSGVKVLAFYNKNHQRKERPFNGVADDVFQSGKTIQPPIQVSNHPGIFVL